MENNFSEPPVLLATCLRSPTAEEGYTVTKITEAGLANPGEALSQALKELEAMKSTGPKNVIGVIDIKLKNVRPMFELSGRNYIVIGGLRGIGYAAVRSLCELGANVAVLDIQAKSKEVFSSVEDEFNTKVYYFQADVTKLDSLNAGVDKAIEALGSLDGCLPCAGINCNKPFVDQSWDDFTRIQEINVRGTYFTVQRVVKQLIKQGTPGSIVMIASQCAHIAIPGCRMSSYNASKGGVLMLTKALRVELAKHNIRVNSISPGYIESQMFRDVLAT
ncbi:D-arabinitol 2-dehydrogenase [Fusarium phyllophilum]|uniref:D-arabinitol 2-dehydrogenase n=1 Tax=Fusarium phyllophilum TaxID=47803 RepID=A0A8H5IKN0_9HYPO|nr:D-arabinitol 2-dehydrogenase [Fusarium phyllophilum]